MFTQQAPALTRALRNALQPGQLEQLTRSLGNCQQPLAHRGPVHIAPPASLARNNRGVYGPGTWDPAQYPGLIPSSGNAGLYDIGGMDAPVWNSGNKYASAFNFPTEQYFTQNQFFGGPQVYVSQGANIEYITNQNFDGDRVTVNNITVKQINNQSITGPAGPAGQPGRDGRPGAPGDDGVNAFAIPRGHFRPLKYLTGLNPRVQPVKKTLPVHVRDLWVHAATTHYLPTDAINNVTVTVSPEAASVVIPTAVTFDADACAVTFSGTTTIWYASTATVTASVSTVSASSSPFWATAATTLGASTLSSRFHTLEGIPAPVTIMNVRKGTPHKVCETAFLQFVTPAGANVFQQ